MNVPISPKIEVSSSSQEPIKKVIYDEKTGFLDLEIKFIQLKYLMMPNLSSFRKKVQRKLLSW